MQNTKRLRFGFAEVKEKAVPRRSDKALKESVVETRNEESEPVSLGARRRTKGAIWAAGHRSGADAKSHWGRGPVAAIA